MSQTAPSAWLASDDIEARFGRLQLRLAKTKQDMQAVQRLRAVRFRGDLRVSDLDRFDPFCAHLLVSDADDGAALCAARLRLLCDHEEITRSYCAQVYDLERLAASGLRLMEIGRICLREDHVQDPDTPRALLAGLTRAARAGAADMLIGCASFRGADPERHRAALRYLHARHIGPEDLRPTRGTGEICELAFAAGTVAADDLRGIPALLRLYLAMGGWVSDHAVCDRDLDTLHVFAAVDISAIPAARLQRLQMLARR